MNKAYNTRLMEIGEQVATEMGIDDIVHKGVYTCLGGPNFETVAELKMLRMVGVDAVGTFVHFLILVNKLTIGLQKDQYSHNNSEISFEYLNRENVQQSH